MIDMLDEYIGVKKALKLGIYDSQELKKHNTQFILNKLAEYKEYFDHLYDEINPNISLDLEQRIAILTDEDYNLIIAGAGSGKTTTMIAKIKYLIDKCNIPNSKILAISFARKNVDELDEKLNKVLKLNVDVKTFHQLGKSILDENDSKKAIANDSIKYNIYLSYFKEKLFQNKNDLKDMIDFLACYLGVDENMYNFDSLEEFHKYKSDMLFESLKDNLNNYNDEIIKKRYTYRRSIQSEYLRSNEEVKIANFLYLNGLEYEYEKRYLYNNNVVYHPDFTIKQGENTIYLEHFGINQNGTCLYYSEDNLNKYIHNINLNKQIHVRNGTKMIATYSKFNDGRSLLTHLEELLQENGFVLKRKSDEEIFKKLCDTSIDSYFYKYIILAQEFIDKFKLNDYSYDMLDKMFNSTNNLRTKMFLKTIKPLYIYYQEQLEKKNLIDFEDMIIKATKVLKNNNNLILKKYKYLIIDEYQDISKQRFDLVKEFSDLFSSNVIAVGDDWQAIFSFAGSNVELFTKFEEEMGYGEVLKITRTYRNAQELIDVAGEFVQKDENNLKKTLHSNKHIDKPVCVYSYDDSEKIYNKALVIANIINEIYTKNPNSSILLIGRYNSDIDQLIKTGLFIQHQERIISIDNKNAQIQFATVHKSKGLEFDEVIVINAINSTYGFPSKVKDDPIFEILGEKSNQYAEERRLFYVALTRTKNKVYIIVPKSKPSPFVIELKNNINVEFMDDAIEQYTDQLKSIKCPKCGGILKKVYFKDINSYIYRCCSDDEICDFKTIELNHKINLKPCPNCNGYLMFKTMTTNGNIMLGCSNYDIDHGCKYVEFINQ